MAGMDLARVFIVAKDLEGFADLLLSCPWADRSAMRGAWELGQSFAEFNLTTDEYRSALSALSDRVRHENRTAQEVGRLWGTRS